MAVRSFDGASRVELALGSVAAMNTGAVTILVLARRAVDLGDYMAVLIGHSGSARRGLAAFNPDDLTMLSGGLVVESAQPWLVADGWAVVGFGKDAGSATPRFHYKPLVGVWSHSDGGGTIGDDVTPLDAAMVLGQQDGSFGYRGLLAVAGVWLGNLADGAIEAAGLDTSLSGWLTADAAWALNQSTTADPVLDLVGGAHQTALVGTTVVGEDPPGFSFSLAVEAAADLAGAGALAAAGRLVAAGGAGLAGVGALAAAARLLTEPRDLQLQLGAPATKWRVDWPDTRWKLDEPELKWVLGAPSV